MAKTLGDMRHPGDPPVKRHDAAALLAENEELRRTLADTRGQVEKLESELAAARALESIGRLASSIAHDFSNVMAVVSGYSELLLRRLHPTDVLRSSAESIRKASEWGLNLTEQLRRASRAQPAPRTPSDVNVVVGNVARTLSPLLGDGIEVVLRLAPDAGHVDVGSGQLERVVMNLVLNARDAMPGGGRLTIETARVALEPGVGARPGPGAVLRVGDTGCGMDDATLARAFEPYFTTKAPGKGTGLGLATVFGIVTQHGGRIDVRSEVGCGSVFSVSLPAPVAGDAAEAPAAPRVLVVEDEPAVLDLMVEIVAMEGAAVLGARSMDEALALVADRGPVAVVVADVDAPGVEGGRLLDRLITGRSGAKVLYVSDELEPVAGTPGSRRAGPVLHKPFTVEEFARALRALLPARA